MSDLVICKLSDASASVGGGKEMILLCEKVAKGMMFFFIPICANHEGYLLVFSFKLICRRHPDSIL